MTLLPGWYEGVKAHHQAEAENVAAELDALHLKCIEMADEVFVVNCRTPDFPDGYIGDRTRKEINYASVLGKPIKYSVEPRKIDE